MTINKVSFLGSSQAQIGRLKDLNSTLNDLTRQMTTKKLHTTLAGFGADAATVQRNRTEKSRVESYISNLDAVTNRIKQMDNSMSSARDTIMQLIDGITTAVRDSSADIGVLSALAKNGLAFMQDLANSESDGRYLFAGSDSASPPVQSASTLNSNMQAQVDAWMNGSITTAQLQANFAAFTTADLGMNPGLSAAGEVSIRIDDSSELNYTVLADQDGFQEMIRALGLMANMREPQPGDTPTTADIDSVVQTILSTARAAVEQLDAASTRVGMNFNLIKDVQANHEKDVAMLEGLIGEAEDADTTEVVAQIQSLQTQLQASYEVTNIVNQLSLINFL